MPNLTRVVTFAAGACAAATALAGLSNTVIGKRTPSLGAAIDAPFREYDWDGGRVGYYVAGQGDPILLLHSHNAAGSAWEMRRLFPLLTGRHTVYAPDLPGYGRSERRPREYQNHTYIRFLHDFVHDVIGRPAIVVASSVTAAQALVAIDEDAHAFTHLVCVSPTGLGEDSGAPPGFVRSLGEAIKWPIMGQALFNAITSHGYIRQTLTKSVYHDAAKVTNEEVSYSWTSAHQPNARFAPAAFLNGDLWPEARAAYSEVRRPLMIVWGEYDGFGTRARSQEGIALNPSARIEVVSDCGSTPHAERPTEFAAILRDFLAASAD